MRTATANRPDMTNGGLSLFVGHFLGGCCQTACTNPREETRMSRISDLVAPKLAQAGACTKAAAQPPAANIGRTGWRWIGIVRSRSGLHAERTERAQHLFARYHPVGGRSRRDRVCAVRHVDAVLRSTARDGEPYVGPPRTDAARHLCRGDAVERGSVQIADRDRTDRRYAAHRGGRRHHADHRRHHRAGIVDAGRADRQSRRGARSAQTGVAVTRRLRRRGRRRCEGRAPRVRYSPPRSARSP